MTALNLFGTLRPHQRDMSQTQILREKVARAMQRPLDPRDDKDLVRQLSRELNVGEDLVAAQVSAVRLQVTNQMVDRVRGRAIAEGLKPASAAKLSSLAGVQALALATRDALVRARQRQHGRLGHESQVAEVFEQEQHVALMRRFEQDDEQLAQDFDEAVREIVDEDERPRLAA